MRLERGKGGEMGSVWAKCGIKKRNECRSAWHATSLRLIIEL